LPPVSITRRPDLHSLAYGLAMPATLSEALPPPDESEC
jgi:hypothetical protein